jgi:hypothetical protein
MDVAVDIRQALGVGVICGGEPVHGMLHPEAWPDTQRRHVIGCPEDTGIISFRY